MTAGEPESMGGGMAKGPRILVVDDELDMRIFIATLLKTSGYDPVVCRDGTEGIRRAGEDLPDLIILDVMMPGEGGVKMYRDLKTDARFRNVPILMLTGVGERSFAHYIRMLKSTAPAPIPDPDAYIEKPPDPQSLLQTVRKLVSGT